MINIAELVPTQYFLWRCVARARTLVKPTKGGAWVINVDKLHRKLAGCKEVKRPSVSLWRKIKHTGDSRYFVSWYGKLSKRYVFVISQNKLVTLYPYVGGWAEKLDQTGRLEVIK